MFKKQEYFSSHLNEEIMSFKKHGYFIIRNFLEPDFVKFIQSYFFTRINAGQAINGDIQAPHSYLFYGDPLMDTILGNSTKSLSEIVGFNLLPTYSYTRFKGSSERLLSPRPPRSESLSLLHSVLCGLVTPSAGHTMLLWH